MKRTAPAHPKMRALARRLQIPLYAAVGLVELVLHFAAEHTPAGDVGRYSDQDLADSVAWDRDATELVTALVDSGWLDRDEEHRLVVHDFADHADEGIHAKVARAQTWFVSGAQRQPKTRKLERGEREKADQFYATHPAPHSAEPAPSGRPEGALEASGGASPSPSPSPLPERESPEQDSPAASGTRSQEPELTDPPARLTKAQRLELWRRAQELGISDARWLGRIVAKCLAYSRSHGQQRVDWMEESFLWILRERTDANGRHGRHVRKAQRDRIEPGSREWNEALARDQAEATP